MDGDPVAPGDDPLAGLNRPDGESLAGAEGVCPHPFDDGRRVREEHEAASDLLSLLKPEEGLIDCEDLRVKDLLV